MNEKKSHNVDLSEEEFQLIQALKANPAMLNQLTSVTEKFNEEVANGMDAYEAECHVIKAISEIGRSMISNRAEQTQEQAVEEATKSANVIKHGKKNSTGTAPLEK